MIRQTGPIEYTDPFRTQVGGRLAARFRPDRDGKPLFVRYGDDRRLRFYTIELLLKGPHVKDVTAVDYFMDDPSFEDDPTVSSDDAANEFPGEIETYGDIEIVVTAHAAGRKIEQRVWLSQMLESNYGKNVSPPVKEAIERIKAY